jgi:hypothetical protein
MTKIEKDKIAQEAISVCDDTAKTLSDWVEYLYDLEWPDLRNIVAQIKTLKEAAIRRRRDSGH